MSLSLDALLSLVGHLDDTPGFDTARERFRRFLVERVTDLPTARALIEDCQRSVGEQHHRALHDLIVAVGRLIGFEVTFGPYDGSADDSELCARWRSPGLLDAALEIRTEQNASATLERLARATAATSEAADRGQERSIGLCILARQFAPRGKLDRQLAAHAGGPALRVLSARSILALAAHVCAGDISHADGVELLRSNHALDFMIDLLNRSADNEPACWVATVTGDEMATPEQLLESVILHRRVLATFHTEGSPGDWVCFFVADRGIVGHAQLESVIANGPSVVRDADRFSRVYRLAQVALYAQPIVQALRASRPFTVPVERASNGGAYLAPVGRQDFLALTAFRADLSGTEHSRAASA
jgi:hypothetical protein